MADAQSIPWTRNPDVFDDTPHGDFVPHFIVIPHNIRTLCSVLNALNCRVGYEAGRRSKSKQRDKSVKGKNKKPTISGEWRSLPVTGRGSVRPPFNDPPFGEGISQHTTIYVCRLAYMLSLNIYIHFSACSYFRSRLDLELQVNRRHIFDLKTLTDS